MNAEEFIEKVMPVNAKLYRFALRLLSNREEAEDIVQETILRLWDRRKKLINYKSVDALAMMITKNLCIDYLKSGKNHRIDMEIIPGFTDSVSQHHEFEVKDSLKNVNKIIDRLPDQQKIIIQLRDIEGYSFEEISGIMNLNINTIRVNLSRARKFVRDTLSKTYDYELKRN